MGSVIAVCSGPAKGKAKIPRPEVVLVAGHGIDGDAHAGPWHRQVSMLAADDIESMRRRGLPNLTHGAFAENVVLDGIDLNALGLGSRLRLGDAAEVTITQRGKVCHTPCAIGRAVGDCIMPRYGLFARVVTPGTVRPGDPAEVVATVPAETLQAVVLTVSDSRSRGEAPDTAGPRIAAMLRDGLGAHIYATEIIPDDQPEIEARLRHYADGHSIDLVVAVGGTGFAPRDVTPEAVRAVAERLTPGLDEAMRAASLAITPHAMLSRACSGIRLRTLILSLPGSAKAAAENLHAILPALPHGLAKLRGDTTPCAPTSPDA